MEGCSSLAAEIVADVAHVQHADARFVHLGHLDAVRVEDGELQLVRGPREAAAPVPPRTRQHGQAAERPKDHRAVAMMLWADERPQQRRLRRGVFAREPFDLFDRETDRVRYTIGRVLPGALGQRVVADRVLRNVVGVDEAVADDDVHHRQRERRIAGRLDLNVPVGRFRRPRPDRIDDDDLRAAALRLAHERPEVEVRDDRVGSPQHDVAAVDDVFGIDSRAGPDRRGKAGVRDRAADVSIEIAAAHRPEQAPVDRRLLDQALHTRGAVRQDRFRAGLLDDRLPSRGDVGQRLVPGHAREATLPFRTDALQRVQHAVGMVHALEVVIDLRAQRPAREGMLGIAVHPLGCSVPDLHDPAARIRAIVAAGAADGVGRH